MTQSSIKAIIRNMVATMYESCSDQSFTDDSILTAPPFNLEGIDLVYLFFAVETTFNIVIPEKRLENYSFVTINGIATIVSHCVEGEIEHHS